MTRVKLSVPIMLLDSRVSALKLIEFRFVAAVTRRTAATSTADAREEAEKSKFWVRAA